MTDLSLASIDEMMKEIERRSVTFISAYELPKDKQTTGNFATYFGKGEWLRSCAMSAVLNNDCLNNWNGELQTLQRLTEEDITNEG